MVAIDGTAVRARAALRICSAVALLASKEITGGCDRSSREAAPVSPAEEAPVAPEGARATNASASAAPPRDQDGRFHGSDLDDAKGRGAGVGSIGHEAPPSADSPPPGSL